MSVRSQFNNAISLGERAMPGRPAGGVAIWHRAICNWIDIQLVPFVRAGQQRV